MITFEQIRDNPEIRAYIQKGNANLGVLGFTEHSLGHAGKAAATAGNILLQLGHPEREIELARIAGYMHDLGNCINRTDHAHSGALMAMQILTRMGMDPAEIAVVIAAIGNHDEKTGTAVDAVSAAETPEGRRALPGSVSFVPSVAGLIIAGEVIKDLAG